MPSQLTIKFNCDKCKKEVEGFAVAVMHVDSITDGCDTCGYGSGANISITCPVCGHYVSTIELG